MKNYISRNIKPEYEIKPLLDKLHPITSSRNCATLLDAGVDPDWDLSNYGLMSNGDGSLAAEFRCETQKYAGMVTDLNGPNMNVLVTETVGRDSAIHFHLNDPAPGKPSTITSNVAQGIKEIHEGRAVSAVISVDPGFTDKLKDLMMLQHSRSRWILPRPSESTKRKPDNNLTPTEASDTLLKTFPKPRWAIPGFVPEGVTLFTGKPKIGKSWMALSMALSVSSGGVFLSHARAEKGTVLYLALEETERRIQTRLTKLGATPESVSGLKVYYDGAKRIGDGFEDQLCKQLEAFPGSRLVIIDTLAKIKPKSKKNGSTYDDDYQIGDALTPISKSYSTSILLVHHNRKLESPDPMDLISGTTGLVGGVDGAMVLRRLTDQSKGMLFVNGRDIEEMIDYGLSWDQSRALWSVEGSAQDVKRGDKQNKIIAILRAKPLLTKTQIHNELVQLGEKEGPDATRKIIDRMCGAQVLTKHGKAFALNSEKRNAYLAAKDGEI